MDASERARTIRQAAFIAIAGNAILAAGKISIGFITGSLSVVGDGIDSSTDILVSFVTLVVAKIVSKPSDAEHPYGHGRAETIATAILAFIIFFAGAQLLLGTIHDLRENADMRMPGAAALWVTAVSIAGKLLLAWSQFRAGKRIGSGLLIANGRNMRNDVLISSGILLGLGLVRITGLPAIDRYVAIAVSLWIMKSAVGIFRETNDELMDGVSDKSLYAKIFAAVRSVPGAGNPHRMRTRRLAAAVFVDLDIEVDGELRVTEAHAIAMEVERAIKKGAMEVCDVMVHVEPAGNAEEESFGLDGVLLDKASRTE